MTAEPTSCPCHVISFQGYDVTLLEAGAQPGGLVAGWRSSSGRPVEVGIHGAVRCGEGGRGGGGGGEIDGERGLRGDEVGRVRDEVGLGVREECRV